MFRRRRRPAGGTARAGDRGRRLAPAQGSAIWALTALYVLALLGLAGYLLAASGAMLNESLGRLFAVVWTVPAIGALAAAVHGIVRAYNSAHWLDGTVLVARRVGGTVRCDLSRAAVEMDHGFDDPRLGPNLLDGRPPDPWLTARTPGERPLRIRLRRTGTMYGMSPDDLRALAAAIMHGRTGDGDRAAEVAGELVWLAGAPAGRPAGSADGQGE
ncbi:hypothetical protein [Spirillospora sp. NPDC029432]|uniref:hypothetical protein n=1 Tax=Spirillospora sp. NPDC029432 TaxID=3154599 RepID=UPI003454685E